MTSLVALVGWLEMAGCQRILLFDNGSTYEPLLDYYRETPHEVVYLGGNLGARSLWLTGTLIDNTSRFVFTDPDIVPIEDCPLDLLDHLAELLDRYPAYGKAGPGLYIDDVPEGMLDLKYERGLYDRFRLMDPGVYRADIDTTFALYRPGTDFRFDALRCGYPYQARHTSWYGPPTDEDLYYLAHAHGGPEGSSWKDALEGKRGSH